MGIVPAIIGGVSAIAGGAIAAGGAKSAAQTQADAAAKASETQLDIYNRTRQDLSPFIRLGTGAINNLSSLLPGGLKLSPSNSGSGNALTTGNTGSTSDGSAPGGGLPPGTSYVPGTGYVSTNSDGSVSVSQTLPSGGSGAAPAFESDPSVAGTSPFLANVQGLLPGGGDSSLKAATDLLPGGSDPLNSALRSYLPGSGTPENSLTSSLQNFIPGASGTPDASLSALRSFVPGGGTENPLLKTLNGLLGVPTTPAAKYGKADVDNLMSSYKEAVAKSGLSADDFLKTDAGKAFVSQRNDVINGLTDPDQLARFSGPDAAPDAQQAAQWRIQNLAEQTAAGSPDANSIQKALEATPGYQFVKQQGQQGVQNSFAAKGLGNSGAALKGAADYTTGLANSTYEQRLNDYLNSYNSQYTNTQNAYNAQFTNNLNAYNTSFANTLNTTGQGFTNALNSYNSKFTNAYNAYGQQLNAAGNLVTTGENAAANQGTIGQNTGQTVGNTLVGGANATAAGIVGSTNAITNSIGNVAGIAGSYFSNNGGGGGGSGASTTSNALFQNGPGTKPTSIYNT